MAQAIRKSTIPRYYAIWRTLWSRITSGYYPAGSLLGTEVAMAAEFGVSRVTLREALSLLEGEGLIERGEIMDGKTLVGLLYLRAFRAGLRG